MTDDTEVLRRHLVDLALANVAAREKIGKALARAHRRVQAQHRDRLWLAAELHALEERVAELRRLLPELHRRDRQAERHQG